MRSAGLRVAQPADLESHLGLAILAGLGPWEEGGRGKANLPECSNTHDSVGGERAREKAIYNSGSFHFSEQRRVFHTVAHVHEVVDFLMYCSWISWIRGTSWISLILAISFEDFVDFIDFVDFDA